MSTEDCWLCPSTFPNKRGLKNHVTAAPHMVFKVICPFCVESKKTLRRMVSLRDHCKSEHESRLKVLPDKFFSESNGYWLAVSPRDYGRAAGIPDYNDKLAIATRIRMLEWAKDCRGERRADWEARWDRKGRVSTPASEASFSPDYVDNIDEPPTKRQRPTTLSYDPDRPSLDDGLVVHSLATSSDGITAELYLPGGALWYQVEVNLPQEGSERLLASVSRRMLSLKPDVNMTRPTGDGVKVEGNRFHVLSGKVATALQIDKRLLRSIISHRSNIRTAVRVAKPSETEQAPLTTQPPADKDTDVSQIDASENPKTNDDRDRDSDHTSESDTCSNHDSETDSDDGSESDSDHDNDQDDATKDLEDTRTVQSVPSIVVKLPVAIRSTWGLSQEERARRILQTGCMPLVPPGRRAWDADSKVSLDAPSGPFQWPPKGWTTYNQDQRLLAWEFAAMTMAMSPCAPLEIPPDRSDLLDRYNMLALPGTPPPTNPLTSKRKAKYYNYDVLRLIATGQTDEDSDDLLRCFESAMQDRSRVADDICEKIRDIPLRLTED